MEKLKNFREIGDPFTEFFEILQIIHKQKESMFEKLQIKKKEIDTKLKNRHTWVKVSSKDTGYDFSSHSDTFGCDYSGVCSASHPSSSSYSCLFPGFNGQVD
ncbi:hypothetical protein ACJRO7_027671 [Eucalyptus globulus]|uniref:Uncharacterized protein n=1 Tax=Eucalyptus globulus TaxID=34317 RepID=A0ABD3JVQ3_EUCGL